MFRVRKLTETRTPINRTAIEESQAILRAQFPGMAERDIEKLPDQLEHPFKYRFTAHLFVAEDAQAHVRGLALMLLAPDLGFAFLDVVSAAPRRSGGGLGAVLYERVREEALALGAKGLYFECLPDDPALSPNADTRAQNQARLRFYERYGARPIIGTAYETPLKVGETDSPYLVFDGLGRFDLPTGERLRAIVRAILERKYGDICPPGYIAKVLRSIVQGKYDLRPARYTAAEPKREVRLDRLLPIKIPLIVNERHQIHHVRERGYVEAPVRVSAILKELDKTELFERVAPKRFSDRFIREVHDGGLVDFIVHTSAQAPANKSIYPYVFPIRNPNRRPGDRSVLAGYWCIDTFTPINRDVYPAARRAVDCALTAAERVLEGEPIAYALVRPPGHHAERRAFGGFCYFNNAAIAAQFLSRYGKVAILDIDYHHGNGTQEIFYERADVLTVSIHGHPRFAYPYFTGFRDERGRGPGAGYNLNIPLGETITPEMHREAVRTALRRIARHQPAFLVLAVGFDSAKGDPTGTWQNGAADFRLLGKMLGEAGWPLVVVQEGGYRVRTLGVNARNFFSGLSEGAADALAASPKRRARPSPRPLVETADINWREAVTERDPRAIERLVASTGMFTTAETAIALELAVERVAKGRSSGYEFIIAEADDKLLGYACYGPTPGTEATFDLYWIVVGPDAQRRGLGRMLLERVETAVRRIGGHSVYVDTSSSEKYEPTRRFYRRTGFRKVAELPDFYRRGDGKVIMVKDL